MTPQTLDWQLILARLEKVEAQNRSQRRALWLVLTLLGGILLTGLIGPWQRMPAKEVALLDAEGHVRGTLKVVDASSRLALPDFGSITRAVTAGPRTASEPPKSQHPINPANPSFPATGQSKPSLSLVALRTPINMKPAGSRLDSGVTAAGVPAPATADRLAERNENLRPKHSTKIAQRTELEPVKPAVIQREELPLLASLGTPRLSVPLLGETPRFEPPLSLYPVRRTSPFRVPVNSAAALMPGVPAAPAAILPGAPAAPARSMPVLPSVSLKAIGYVENPGSPRKAVISDEGNNVFIVHEGDTFSERFTVLTLQPTLVEIEDGMTGQTVRLSFSP